MNKFVFAIPVIILLVGVIGTFILNVPIIPMINGIGSPGIVGLVWVAGLITSLFFAGRQLQAKPKSTASNAILNKKEPYLMMLDVSNTLNQLKSHKSSKHLDAVIYAVKVLEEKLSVESDFGYGSNAVISCENNIARQIQFITDIVLYIENGDLDVSLNAVNVAVMNINSLLRRRTELKKR